ncbi:MAG: acetolactate synthase large subunit, partial [Synergistaceae bacterium]|nr:acetolactate synthase large subunit [Synergistaceae bacterium]
KPKADLSRAGEAADLLGRAERPVILAGGGVLASGASDLLLSFAEKRGIPVANTLMGKSAFPDDHPLSLGMAGMHGTPEANLALTEADVIFALGTRFSDRTTGRLDSFAKGAVLIHGDIDEAEIDKIVPSQVSLLGDARATLEVLEGRTPPAERGAWAEKIRAWKDEYPLSDPETTDFVPSAIMERVKDASGENWPAVADVGQNQMWTALFYKTSRPGAFLTSGGLGTMGYALPAAMGASLVGGKTPTVCFAGDGGFLMNCQELETCARYGIPVKIFVLNNHALGMVRQWQELFWDERYSATTPQSPCRFDALAEALGVKGYGCDTLEELEELLPEMMDSPGPALVDCRIAREELILPMVPAGAALKDFLHRVKV